MTNAAVMRSVSLALNSYVNSAVNRYAFTLVASVPVSASNKVIISFPSQITLPSKESDLACSTSETNYFDSVKCSFYKTSSISNGIKVDLNVKSSIGSVAAFQSFSIFVNNIKNPGTTKPSSSITVTIVDSSLREVNPNPTPLIVSTNTANPLKKASIT